MFLISLLCKALCAISAFERFYINKITYLLEAMAIAMVIAYTTMVNRHNYYTSNKLNVLDIDFCLDSIALLSVKESTKGWTETEWK